MILLSYLLFFVLYLLFRVFIFLYEILLLCSSFYLISPKFTLKKKMLSTSSLKRDFRPSHLPKSLSWPQSHKANDCIGHILVFVWLHHIDSPGSANHSGFMVTLTTSWTSHFSPVWLLWLMTQFVLTVHTACDCFRDGKGLWEKPVPGTTPLENYPFRRQTDSLSLVFSCFSPSKCF